MSQSTRLLRDRRFYPLFATQFLGAFNDNVFKQLLIMLLVFHTASYSDMPAALLTNLAAGLFILPFFVGSGVAAQLADKYDKAWLAQHLKRLECLLMALAGIGLAWQSLGLLLFVLCAMGAQSALFGPIKYAWLPERLPTDQVFSANAWVETATSLAILLGSLFGGMLVAHYGTDWRAASLSLLVIAALGLISSLLMPRGPAINSTLIVDWHIVRNTQRCIRTLRSSASRWRVSLSISWFWLFGVLWLTQLPEYTARYLGGDASVASILLAAFSVGIALGAQFCQLAHRRIHEYRLVFLGGLAMAISSALLPWHMFSGQELQSVSTWFSASENVWISLRLALVGVAAGLYIVPLYAHIQLNCQQGECAEAIAGINVLNALFMVGGSLAAMIVLGLMGFSLSTLLLTLAALTTVVTWHWRLRVG